MLRSFIFGYNLDWSLRMRKSCLSKVIKLLGVQLEVCGTPYEGHYMYIGNHRSYLDPIIALCNVMALPVGKAEVSKWPLIGYSAKVTGIVFVKRESRNSRKETLDAMVEILQKGNSVLIYPEGTTHDKPETIDFKMGAFRLAADHQFSIIPMAIDYTDPNNYWVTDITFAQHFAQQFSKWKTVVKIEYGEPIQGNDKEKLMLETKEWIDKKLAKF
ncbi:MAG: 1-acyl-sn-glycerol-3-phosphate acyltransferase [Saprospiraceae bacterium]